VPLRPHQPRSYAGALAPVGLGSPAQLPDADRHAAQRQRAAGTIVTFEIAGANTQGKIGRLDASGTATISYRAILPRADSVTASILLNPSDSSSKLVSNPASITWGAPLVPALGLLGAALLVLVC
jgi:hypothetical protein